MNASRECALDGCEERLGESYRSHALYCSPRCRAEASRRRRKSRGIGKRTEAHSASASGRRRDSGDPAKPGRRPTLYVVCEVVGDSLTYRGCEWETKGNQAVRKVAARNALDPARSYVFLPYEQWRRRLDGRGVART